MILGILGTGLMGASIGLRARQNGDIVLGYDDQESIANIATANGALDRIVSRDELYARCDFVVIAGHLNTTLAEISHLGSRSRLEHQIIIDISSVKLDVCEAARGIPNFVGTHPMAGSEHRGPKSARVNLFNGRSWAYIPASNPGINERVCAWICLLGAKPFAIDAVTHDALVASTSHLPQLYSLLFSKMLTQLEPHSATDALMGPTAHELLRLARSNGDMWGPIFDANRAALSSAARALAYELLASADALDTRDATMISQLFSTPENGPL